MYYKITNITKIRPTGGFATVPPLVTPQVPSITYIKYKAAQYIYTYINNV